MPGRGDRSTGGVRGSGLDIRVHLIEVTQRLIAEHGPAILTIRRIARAAGVSDGVLYNYFRDKDDLILTALTDLVGDIIRGFIASIPTPGAADLVTNLDQLGRRCLHLQQQFLPLVAGLLTRPDLLRRFMDAVHDQPEAGPQHMLRAITDYLAQEQRLGRIDRDASTETAAAALFGTALMEAIGRHIARIDDAEPHLEGVASLLARGLQPPN